MPQYLVAIHHPDGYDGSLEGEAMVRDIDVLNEEMEAAGARFFAGGLSAASNAASRSSSSFTASSLSSEAQTLSRAMTLRANGSDGSTG